MRQKSLVRTGLFILFLMLAFIYFGGFPETYTNAIDRRIFSKLIKIYDEQKRYNFTLSKSKEAIDKEIIDQLTQKTDNKTTNNDSDIREWFDSRPKSKPSPKDKNTHPFFQGFEIENSRVCDTESVDILIYIQSAAEHRERRDMIRNTWGRQRLFHDIVVRTIFVLGMPVVKEDQMDVELEHSIYGDIVQGKFNDTFTSLAYKAITTLVWINTHCPSAKTILRTDDDIFVDIFRVVQEFIPLLDKGNMSVVCNFLEKSTISREPTNKYYVPPNYLPSAVRWPPFCSGYFVLMSGNMVPMLYERSFQPDKIVPMDDAYVFGILTDGMEHISVTNVHPQVYYSARPDAQQELNSNGYLEYIAFAMPQKAIKLWELRLQKLTDWDRSHSLYVKLFETPGIKSVVID